MFVKFTNPWASEVVLDGLQHKDSADVDVGSYCSQNSFNKVDEGTFEFLTAEDINFFLLLFFWKFRIMDSLAKVVLVKDPLLSKDGEINE